MPKLIDRLRRGFRFGDEPINVLAKEFLDAGARQVDEAVLAAKNLTADDMLELGAEMVVKTDNGHTIVRYAGNNYVCTLCRLGGSAGFSDANERAIAEYLEELGRKVEKNPLEGVEGAGRQGDAYVDGVKHEFKTPDPGATANTIRNLVNRSKKGTGQAREIVIDARGSGLSEAEALQGTYKALGSSRGKIDGVTVIGDNYFFRSTPRG